MSGKYETFEEIQNRLQREVADNEDTEKIDIRDDQDGQDINEKKRKAQLKKM